MASALVLVPRSVRCLQQIEQLLNRHVGISHDTPQRSLLHVSRAMNGHGNIDACSGEPGVGARLANHRETCSFKSPDELATADCGQTRHQIATLAVSTDGSSSSSGTGSR